MSAIAPRPFRVLPRLASGKSRDSSFAPAFILSITTSPCRSSPAALHCVQSPVPVASPPPPASSLTVNSRRLWSLTLVVCEPYSVASRDERAMTCFVLLRRDD